MKQRALVCETETNLMKNLGVEMTANLRSQLVLTSKDSSDKLREARLVFGKRK